MAITRFANPSIMAVLAILVAATGGWAVYREAGSVAAEPGLSSVARLVRSLGTDDNAALSTSGQFAILQNCAAALNAPNSLEIRYLSEEERNALLPHCRETARDAVEAFPTDSYAWTINALAAAQDEDWAVMNDSLVRSHITGPNEYWVAQRRADVALDNYAQLDEAARLAGDKDLILLLRSIPGSRFIAQRYVSDVEFRARIESLVATAPPEVQRRFISVVRREIS